MKTVGNLEESVNSLILVVGCSSRLDFVRDRRKTSPFLILGKLYKP